MRIIHIVSNFRWTERVEPVADLAIAQSRLGHDVRYLCGRNRGAAPEDCIQGRAEHKKLVYDDNFELAKHFEAASARQDMQKLRSYFLAFKPDVVHCHLPNAHFLASCAMRSMKDRPLLVRTFYEPQGPQWPLRYWLLSRPPTDGIILINKDLYKRVKGKFKRDPWRTTVWIPGIDIEEFTRQDLGRLEHISIPDDAFVLGMVTAIGARRRLDLALAAVANCAKQYPTVRLMICGRGKIDQFVHEPARKLGIEDRVTLAGYCRNDDLVRAYHTMDALIYPRHGTDESCRTIREAMAAGVPVIAGDTGAAKTLIQHTKTGYVTELSEKSMTAGLEAMLALSKQDRAAMSRNAAEDAANRFCRIKQAEKTIAYYSELHARKHTA